MSIFPTLGVVGLSTISSGVLIVNSVNDHICFNSRTYIVILIWVIILTWYPRFLEKCSKHFPSRAQCLVLYNFWLSILHSKPNASLGSQILSHDFFGQHMVICLLINKYLRSFRVLIWEHIFWALLGLLLLYFFFAFLIIRSFVVVVGRKLSSIHLLIFLFIHCMSSPKHNVRYQHKLVMRQDFIGNLGRRITTSLNPACIKNVKWCFKKNPSMIIKKWYPKGFASSLFFVLFLLFVFLFWTYFSGCWEFTYKKFYFSCCLYLLYFISPNSQKCMLQVKISMKRHLFWFEQAININVPEKRLRG